MLSFIKKRLSNLRKRTKILLALLFVLLIWFYFCLPSRLFNTPTCYVIEDKDGNLLNASIAADGQWRFPYNKNVPDKFIKCITTFEDKRFYSHPGVDPMAMFRALKKNIRNKEVVQGGSTITMQVIRLSRHKEKRNLYQKFVESIQAVRLECRYSKKEILALYASNAPFGSNVVGLDAASWRYFGRGPDKLSWGEMAALAVLPNSPSLVHPGKHRDLLLKKRNFLLDKLVANNTIDKTTGDLAKLEPLPGEPLALPQFAPHLLQRFKDDVRRSDKKEQETIIRTTIDFGLQKNVSNIIEQHHGILKGNNINNAAALVVEVETGNVLAYVGNIGASKDPNLETNVDVIKASRSPGSTLKPVLYAAMLSDGMILPNSIVPDIPTQIGGYTPQNFDLTFDGAVPASRALSRSLNIPAVKLLQQYKYQRFYELLKQCGISTLNQPADHYGLSLILGGSEVTMWDMAGLYSGLARSLNHEKQNKGQILANDFHSPRYLASNLKSEISNLNSALPLDPTSIWFTFQAMQDVMRPGEEGLWQQFTSSQKIAWKTGTSFGFRDGWAIGVTPKYVVVVWVGNTTGEGRPGLIGVQTAAPIMFDIFRQLPSSSWFTEPQTNFTFLPVCRQSGLRASFDCPEVDTTMVPKNGTKAPLCPYHKMIHLDASGNYRVNENCESPSKMINKAWFVLTPAMEWYYRQKNHDYKNLPPYKPGCEYAESGKHMELIYPSPDSKIYVPLEINGQRGKTIFKAAHRKPGAKIFWTLDDEFVTTTTDFHQVGLSPAPGMHIITLVDENGETITRQFEILENGK